MLEQLKLLYRAYKYRYQADKSEIAYLLTKVKKGDVAIDVGAHKGGYTYWMQKAVGDNGKVIAFEPQKVGAELLQQLFPNAVIENKGLSDKTGTQRFFIQPQQFNVSFEASLENKYENAQEVVIETTTLDIYCKENNLDPAFIKIDVEGHEKEVLSGGEEVLKKYKPIVLIEIEERHIGEERMREIFSLMAGVGYEGYFFYKQEKLSISEFKASVHQAREVLERKQEHYCNNFVFEG